jgi:hypothetical protein
MSYSRCGRDPNKFNPSRNESTTGLVVLEFTPKRPDKSKNEIKRRLMVLDRA